MEGFAECFDELEDPRTGNAGRHDLLEILMIALCTVLSGGQTAVDMAIFGREKEPFLRDFLKLEHGPPSHDTFSRIFRLLDPEQFGACFQRFMARFAESFQGVIAIDGKVVRRSFDKASGRSARGCQNICVSSSRHSYCFGNLSAKRMANWFIAAFHSFSGIFHFFSAFRNAR